MSALAPIVPVVFGFRNRLTLLWYYAMFALAAEWTMSLLKAQHLHYLWFANVFMLAEFLCFNRHYYRSVLRKAKKWIVISCGFVGLFLFSTFLGGFDEFNAEGACLFFLLYIVWGAMGLYQLIQRPEVFFLERSQLFWLHIMLLVYASGSFLLFLFKNYLIRYERDLFLSLWVGFYSCLNMLKYLLLAAALRKPAEK